MRSCIYYFSKLRTILDFITGQDETIKKIECVEPISHKIRQCGTEKKRGVGGLLKNQMHVYVFVPQFL